MGTHLNIKETYTNDSISKRRRQFGISRSNKAQRVCALLQMGLGGLTESATDR